MRYPSVHTKLVGLFGHPLGHSLSPAMHNRVFTKLGMDYLYLPIQVEANDLKTVFNGLIRMNFAGFNVTIPHKVRILDFMDEIDPLAEIIVAVNTIRITGGRARGYNTDGIGFITSLKTSHDAAVSGKTLLILGGGGAARAITAISAAQGAQRIYLCNRTLGKAQSMAADLNARTRDIIAAIPMDGPALRDVMPGCDILVNATSVGMHPRTDAIPIDENLLYPGLLVVDLVYNPRMTRLLTCAQKAGCRILGGLGMLVYQGAEAFRLWTGTEPLVDEMFAAVEEAAPKP